MQRCLQQLLPRTFQATPQGRCQVCKRKWRCKLGFEVAGARHPLDIPILISWSCNVVNVVKLSRPHPSTHLTNTNNTSRISKHYEHRTFHAISPIYSGYPGKNVLWIKNLQTCYKFSYQHLHVSLSGLAYRVAILVWAPVCTIGPLGSNPSWLLGRVQVKAPAFLLSQLLRITVPRWT